MEPFLSTDTFKSTYELELGADRVCSDVRWVRESYAYGMYDPQHYTVHQFQRRTCYHDASARPGVESVSEYHDYAGRHGVFGKH